MALNTYSPEFLKAIGLDPEKLKQEQQTQGLLGAGLALLAGSGPSSQPTSLGQLVGQAGQVGLQAMRGAGEDQISNAIRSLQVKDMVTKREQQAKQQQAINAYIQGLPESERAKFAAFPTQAADAMFREKPESFRMLTKDEVAAQGLKPGEYQVSSKTGKISPIGGEKVAVNLSDPTAVSRELREIGKDFTKELKDRGLAEVADRYRALNTSVSSALGGNKQAHGAIIYNVAKIYDPSGAVQEGDKNTVIGNRGLPAELRMLAEKVFSTEGPGVLTPQEITNLYTNVTKIVQDKAALVGPIQRNYALDAESLRKGSSSRLISPFEGIEFGKAIGTVIRKREQ